MNLTEEYLRIKVAVLRSAQKYLEEKRMIRDLREVLQIMNFISELESEIEILQDIVNFEHQNNSEKS